MKQLIMLREINTWNDIKLIYLLLLLVFKQQLTGRIGYGDGTKPQQKLSSNFEQKRSRYRYY
jgi:hypothetical protein